MEMSLGREKFILLDSSKCLRLKEHKNACKMEVSEIETFSAGGKGELLAHPDDTHGDYSLNVIFTST